MYFSRAKAGQLLGSASECRPLFRLSPLLSPTAGSGGHRPATGKSSIPCRRVGWSSPRRYVDGAVQEQAPPLADDTGPEADPAAARRAFLPSNLSLHYKNPVVVKRGDGAYIFDQAGKRYIDCVNNVAHVGHGNAHVNRAIADQLNQINTNTRYLHPTIARYAEKLCSTLSDKMGSNSVVFFCNSGSEANDLAINIAKRVTGNQGIISLDGAYHGHVMSLVDISNYSKYNQGDGFKPPANVKVVPVPVTSGIKYKKELKEVGTHYAKMVADAAAEFKDEKQGTAAFITEVLQSCGGQIVMPPKYLKQAFEATRKQGGLVIADEVQTGFGRSGKRFWMHQLHKGALPDMITFGKPAGNGYPIAGVIVNKAIANEFAQHNAGYFNTFGGNTVAVAAGEAVFDYLDRHGLQADAHVLGKQFKSTLSSLRSPFITDVRGDGLMLGVELSREDGSPGAAEAEYVMNRMKELGVLISTDGPDRNVIKFKPPMVISETDIDIVGWSMEQALEECMQLSRQAY